MYRGSCHCGTVQFELTEPPGKLVNCNGSVCRRFGALWGHVPIGSVKIIATPDSTISYAGKIDADCRLQSSKELISA